MFLGHSSSNTDYKIFIISRIKCLLCFLLFCFAFTSSLSAQVILKRLRKSVLIDVDQNSILNVGDKISVVRAYDTGNVVQIGSVEIARFHEGQCAARILTETPGYTISQGDRLHIDGVRERSLEVMPQDTKQKEKSGQQVDWLGLVDMLDSDPTRQARILEGDAKARYSMGAGLSPQDSIILIRAGIIGTAYGEAVDVSITGVSDGIRSTLQQDRDKAVIDAKLQAVQRAGVNIQSVTEVENFMLKKDWIQTTAEAHLMPGYTIVETGYGADGLYRVVLVGRLRTILRP